MSIYAGPNTIQSGLVLHIDPNNPRSYPGAGSTLFDISGQSNNGTLTNGAAVIQSGPNKVLSFDGTNDGVRINSSQYSYSSGAISFWIKKYSDSVRSAISYQNPINFSNFFTIYIGNGATASLLNELVTIVSFINNSQAVGAFLTSSRSIVIDSGWHHIYVSSTGSKYSIIIDGIQRLVTMSDGHTEGPWMNLVGATVLGIGCRFSSTDSANLTLDGLMDRDKIGFII
jgi:hypothetical protein